MRFCHFGYAGFLIRLACKAGGLLVIVRGLCFGFAFCIFECKCIDKWWEVIILRIVNNYKSVKLANEIKYLWSHSIPTQALTIASPRIRH